MGRSGDDASFLFLFLDFLSALDFLRKVRRASFILRRSLRIAVA